MSEYKPTIPDGLRSGIYFLGLFAGFATIAVIGIVQAVSPEHYETVAAISASIMAAIGWVASATGVAYRPTRKDNRDD